MQPALNDCEIWVVDSDSHSFGFPDYGGDKVDKKKILRLHIIYVIHKQEEEGCPIQSFATISQKKIGYCVTYWMSNNPFPEIE